MDELPGPIKPPVAIAIERCRGCGKEFNQIDRNIYSAYHYRCKEWTGEKGLIKAFINSCNIQ